MENSLLSKVLVEVLHATVNHRDVDWGGILDACGVDPDRSRSILFDGSGRFDESEVLLLSKHLREATTAKMRYFLQLQPSVGEYLNIATPDEGLRLMSAFLKISNIAARASLINTAEHMAAQCAR